MSTYVFEYFVVEPVEPKMFIHAVFWVEFEGHGHDLRKDHFFVFNVFYALIKAFALVILK